jgi:DNA polymerase III epsilon subunit-like protein
MNLFYIDTETTGFNPKKHEIIELAFAIEIDGIMYCKMELFMRPEKWDIIDSKALKINGWTIERLKRLPSCTDFKEVLFQIAGICQRKNYNQKYKIVEYGNRFDYNFLKNHIIFNHPDGMFNFIFNRNSINALSLAHKKLPGLESYKLVDVAAALGIPVNRKWAHSAGYDRDLLIEVYHKLKRR